MIAAKAEFFKLYKEAEAAAAAAPEEVPEVMPEADVVEVNNNPVEYTPVSAGERTEPDAVLNSPSNHIE